MPGDTKKYVFPSDKRADGRSLGKEEIGILSEVIRAGTLNSTAGSMVKRFEREFSGMHEVPFGIATSSGTAGIHAALFALGVGKGDEVVTSPVTDFGAIAPIILLGAVPVFCDLDPETLVPTPESIEERLTPKTKAVIVTHLFGLPCDMDGIMDVTRGIPLVEDCAQAPLARWNGRYAGTFGDVSVFSFQQSKHITSGEGGICLVKDENTARRLKLFVNKGWPYGEENPDHEFLGLNYRMTELQGAVLCAQIRKLDYSVKKRRENAGMLEEMLSGIDGVRPCPVPKEAEHSYWRYPMLVDGRLVPGGAGRLGGYLQEKGIPCQPNYIGRPAFELKAMKEYYKNASSGGAPGERRGFRGTYEGLESMIVFPWNERYGKDHLVAISEAVEEGVERLKGRN